MSLAKEELAEFQEQGYFLKKGLIDQSTIALMSKEVDGLHEEMAKDAPREVGVSWEVDLPQGHAPKIRQLMNSEKVCPSIEEVSKCDEILSVMEQLIGPDIVLFHSKLMMKAANDGTFTPWHQDWGYWQHESKEPSHVNCMLAIDSANDENGALRMVKGSQKNGLQPHKVFKSDSFRIGLEGDLDAYPGLLIEMDPGDGIFFGPLIIHGSAPNSSPNDRRANTFAYDKPGNLLKGEFSPRRYRRGRQP